MASASGVDWSFALTVEETDGHVGAVDVEDLRSRDVLLDAGAAVLEAHVALLHDHADRVLDALGGEPLSDGNAGELVALAKVGEWRPWPLTDLHRR